MVLWRTELGLWGRSLRWLNQLLGWIELMVELQCKYLGLEDSKSDFAVFR